MQQRLYSIHRRPDEVRSRSQPASIRHSFYPPYRSTVKRGPQQPPLRVKARTASEHLPSFSPPLVKPLDADLTAQGPGAPLGEKIVLSGRVVDEDGKPVRRSLVEVWQCNSAGRYFHSRDQHDAPLDPNFYGFGKFYTDDDGRYRFVTIKPGPYPVGQSRRKPGGRRTFISRCSATCMRSAW